jgi:hypothetical protein
MVIVMLVFRFFGFIMAFTVRFWFIVLPVVLLLYYYSKKSKAKKEFKSNTGLDPDKEVKLKQEPDITIESDEK